MITRDDLNKAEEIGAISFEMSGKVSDLIAEVERLRSLLQRWVDTPWLFDRHNEDETWRSDELKRLWDETFKALEETKED